MCDSRSAHNHHSNQSDKHQEKKNDIDKPQAAAKPQTAPVLGHAPERAVPEALREVEKRGYAQANPDPQK